MEKNQYKAVKLQKGEVAVYDFGSAKLHAYKTNDFLSDEVFIIEKEGRAIIVEQPCFFDNISELTDYIASLNVEVKAKLLSYHMAGGTFLPEVPVYATKNADAYSHVGGGKALIDNFTNAFGAIFDSATSTVNHIIDGSDLTIAGVQFNILPTPDAFNIEIPELCVVYTHMLGHDCHSIVAGKSHADAIITELNDYIKRGFDLILNSHYTPEDLKDVRTKIAYINNLKSIATGCTGVEEFKAAMQAKYSDYVGENYLDMTAGFFFPT